MFTQRNNYKTCECVEMISVMLVVGYICVCVLVFVYLCSIKINIISYHNDSAVLILPNDRLIHRYPEKIKKNMTLTFLLI